jgi:hypothetical protein
VKVTSEKDWPAAWRYLKPCAAISRHVTGRHVRGNEWRLQLIWRNTGRGPTYREETGRSTGGSRGRASNRSRFRVFRHCTRSFCGLPSCDPSNFVGFACQSGLSESEISRAEPLTSSAFRRQRHRGRVWCELNERAENEGTQGPPFGTTATESLRETTPQQRQCNAVVFP